MKKIVITISIMVAMLGITTQSFAQTDIIQEEAQGKIIYDDLQANKANCSNISDDDFELLGDYYMGRMMGSSHEAMDNLMEQRMGEENNRLMHIAMGKRLSGCDTSASFPSQGVGFLPMMGMMGNWSAYDSAGSYNLPNNFNPMMGNYFGNSMMGFGYGYGSWIGMILMILFWVLVAVAIVAFLGWLVRQAKPSSRSEEKNDKAIDILKERYAKGEIDKEEFKAKKKDLS